MNLTLFQDNCVGNILVECSLNFVWWLHMSHCMEYYYVAFVVVVSSVVIATRERHFAIFVLFKDTDVWISSWII